MNRKRVCQHCQEAFDLASTGRPPKYCSATCRKAAWEARKMAEAVAVAVAKAVAAERRRANRGNETPPMPGNRGNETSPQVMDPREVWKAERPPVPPVSPPPLPPARRPSRRRSGMTASPMPLPGLEPETP